MRVCLAHAGEQGGDRGQHQHPVGQRAQARRGEQQRHRAGKADSQADAAHCLGVAMAQLAFMASAPVVAPLAGRAAIADPVLDHPDQARVAADRAATEVHAAHHVADPAQFHVLLLQEGVVGEAHPVHGRHAGDAPERLHAQAFGQHAVVEVAPVPFAPLADPGHRHAEGEQRQHRGQQRAVCQQFGIDHQQQAGDDRKHVHHQQAALHALAEVDRQPVGAREHRLDGARGRWNRHRRIVGQQPARGGGDLGYVLARIRVEFAQMVEQAAVALRHRALARRGAVAGEPARVQRAVDLAFGPVARAGDVIDEVAVVVGQQVGRGVLAGQARHLAVQVVVHDLGGNAGGRRRAPVPKREQHLAVRGHVDPVLRVLAVARGPGWRTSSAVAPRTSGSSTTSARASRAQNSARDAASAKSDSKSARVIGSGAMSGMPRSSAQRATSRSPPSASADITTSGRSGCTVCMRRSQARTSASSRGARPGARSRCAVTPTIRRAPAGEGVGVAMDEA